MPSRTPIYGIQYPNPTDPIRLTQPLMQENAHTLEEVLKNSKIPPLGIDLVGLVERVKSLEAAKIDPTPQNLSLLNGFTNASPFFAPLTVRKIGQKMAFIQGTLTVPAAAANNIFAQIPTNFLPAYITRIPCAITLRAGGGYTTGFRVCTGFS